MSKVTQAQISQWKKKWGEVHVIEVPLDDSENGKKAMGYFKKPTLEAIKASQVYAESDPIKSGEVLFTNCWLGGDNDFEEIAEVKLSAIKPLASLFKVRTASIKKL